MQNLRPATAHYRGSGGPAAAEWHRDITDSVYPQTNINVVDETRHDAESNAAYHSPYTTSGAHSLAGERHRRSSASGGPSNNSPAAAASPFLRLNKAAWKFYCVCCTFIVRSNASSLQSSIEADSRRTTVGGFGGPFANTWRGMSRRSRVVSLAILCSLLLGVMLIELNYGPYLRYQMLPVRAKHAVNTLLGDEHHYNLELKLIAEMELRSAQYEARFHDEICADYKAPRKQAWITNAKNELYVLPAIVLGHTIRKYSCEQRMVIMVTKAVGESSRAALRAVGYTVMEMPVIDCRGQSKGYGFGYFADIPGSHMKMYSWNMTQFDRVIYADSDMFFLGKIDELFEFADLKEDEIAASYCQRPGKVDPCFNAGFILLRPSQQTFDTLISTWVGLQETVGCVNDQSYLFHFFVQPGRHFHYFPFAYNVRRQNYHPMRVYHCAGYKPKKPWLVPHTREEAVHVPILEVPQDMYKVWWYYFYEAVDAYGLLPWWEQYRLTQHRRE